MSQDAPATTGTVAFTTRYAAVVGVLLLTIITTLAALWMRERQRRVSAENREALLSAQMEKNKSGFAEMLASKIDLGAVESPIHPFQREDSVPVTVTVDGAPRSAYRLSAGGAARFGFHPGDVILVAEGNPNRGPSRPATSTRPSATAPASAATSDK